jgi:hypothetical protein
MQMDMRELKAWMKERFPAVNLVSAYLLFALVAAVFRYLDEGGVYWLFQDFGLGMALWCQFLVLRVIDEHKDFKTDASLHPERVLQRGRVTLGQLRWVGAGAFVTGLAVTVFLAQAQGAAFLFWLALQGWTLLMTCEFFCGEWLRRRLFLYSLSHMLVLPWMVMWCYALAVHETHFNSRTVYMLLAFTFLNGLIYEVSRKVRGLDEDRPAEPSFTQIWGVKGASWAVIGLLSLSFVAFAVVADRIFTLPWWFLLPTKAAFALSVWAALNFKNRPVSKLRKANEGASALYVLIAYMSFIIFAHIQS